VLVLGAWLLSQRYPGVLGQLFDDTSKAYARQLDALSPGASQHIWALSIVSQMGLFFRYGLLWLIPNVGWMSIDLRPAFPLSLASRRPSPRCWPTWACWPPRPGWCCRSDVLGLIGLCLLFPL
jgi:hypothetical protein